MTTKTSETSGVGHLPQTVGEIEALDWCRALLTEPGTTTFTPQSRDPKNTNPHDRFFGKTLNHSEGVPACVSFHPESPGKSVITELSISQSTHFRPTPTFGPPFYTKNRVLK
ncbi:hypothetical protein LZ30DRAFT_708912, partial [Colletotrichum cereale]